MIQYQLPSPAVLTALGFAQAQLAERVGVRQQTIQKLLAGKGGSDRLRVRTHQALKEMCGGRDFPLTRAEAAAFSDRFNLRANQVPEHVQVSGRAEREPLDAFVDALRNASAVAGDYVDLEARILANTDRGVPFLPPAQPLPSTRSEWKTVATGPTPWGCVANRVGANAMVHCVYLKPSATGFYVCRMVTVKGNDAFGAYARRVSPAGGGLWEMQELRDAE